MATDNKLDTYAKRLRETAPEIAEEFLRQFPPAPETDEHAETEVTFLQMRVSAHRERPDRPIVNAKIGAS